MRSPGWEPRELTDREQRILFKGAATAGKGFVRSTGVPVEIHWTDGERERSAVLAGETTRWWSPASRPS